MIWIGIGTAIIVGLAAYWLLVTTEGTYLGPRAVALMYDWTARRYDDIKGLRFVDEAIHLGAPLARSLKYSSHPLVLDVATGTGRLPRALSTQLGGQGMIVGLDRSRGMLLQAREPALENDARGALVMGDASALAFSDGAFNCVTCLEALEFMASPRAILQEMLRVLKPGGVLLMSNRVGREAGLFPFRVAGRGKLERHLQALGMRDVGMRRWQVHYDLVWALKPADLAENIARP